MASVRPRAVFPAAVFLIAACSGGSPTATPIASPSPSETGAAVATTTPTATATVTPVPSGPQPLKMGTLPAGTYMTTAFVPTLTLTLPDGWHQYFPEDDDEMSLGGGGGVDLNITRPAQVIDPESRLPVDSPESLADWVAKHPALHASAPTALQVAGIDSTFFDLPAPTDDVKLFHYPSGDMHIPPGAQTRIYVVPMEGPDLVLLLFGVLDFGAAVESVEPIIDSLQIADQAG